MLNTPVKSFYKNKVILLTGCTGFLGTAVLEKLLRSFPDVAKIYLLTRSSRKLSAENRMKQYTGDIAFSRIEPRVLSNKISSVVGDLRLEQLGLSEENRNTLIDSVNIVLHCAATVNFNELIRDALMINLKGTNEVLKIASEMKNLQSFVYVSSCYSNCNRKIIEEKLYPNKFPPELLLKMLEDLDENTLNSMATNLVQDWPNTYTFSKNVAELLVQKYSERFPIGIFRPSAITLSYKEPFASWLPKDLAMNFIITSGCLGLAKVIAGKSRGNMACVPVDMTANALLATAWEVSQKKDKEMNIYNYSSTENVITLKDYMKYSLKHASDCKYERASGNPHLYVITKNELLYKFLELFWHNIPGYVMDFYLKVTGKKPKFTYMYKKYHHQTDVIRYFSTRLHWQFVYGNVDKLWKRMSKEEQELLYFDMTSLNWKKCLETAPFGIKKYYFKETLTKDEQTKFENCVNNNK